MKRSHQERVYFKKKKKAPSSLLKFKKQNSYCNRLCKKEQRKYFESLNSRRISDNKRFWKKYNLFPLKNERLAIRQLLSAIKKTLSLKTIWFRRNIIIFLDMQQNVYKQIKTPASITLIATKLTQLKTLVEIILFLLIKSRLKNIPSFSSKEVILSEIERDLIKPKSNQSKKGKQRKQQKEKYRIFYGKLNQSFHLINTNSCTQLDHPLANFMGQQKYINCLQVIKQ